MPDLIRNATWEQIRTVLEDPTIQVGLFGPPGVGKTYVLFDMVNRQLPVIKKGKARPARYVGKVQFHSEMSPSEVMGMYVPDGDKFRWEPGPGDLAYAQGGLLILDEIDQASGPMKTYLYGLLDRGPGGTISYVGRQFVQAEGYQPVATMNDWPDQGALPEALLDRFDAWFQVTQPSPEQIATLDPDLADICRDTYDPEIVKDPMRGPDITFRMLVAIQKLRRVLPIEQAVLGATKNNKILAGSLLEVLALTDPDEETDGVSAESVPAEATPDRTITLTCDCDCTPCFEEDNHEGCDAFPSCPIAGATASLAALSGRTT